jgi:hypothetical protein
MMPMPMRRKTRDIEKVENLCRTATAWKILPAPEQAGSRLRDSMRAERRRAPSLTREGGDGERGHDQIIVEHVGRHAAGARRPTGSPLPEMSHFAAEFYECCANPGSRPLTFAKVFAQPAKLLAMPRDPL